MNEPFNPFLFSARFLTLALLFAAFLPRAFAISVFEGTNLVDFPNNTPGPPYALTNVGLSTFGGTVSGSDNQDRFDITIPPGLQLSQVTKNFTGANNSTLDVNFLFQDLQFYGTNTFPIPSPASPLPAGQYSFFANANAGTGSVWTAYFYVTAAPDYAITTNGSSIIVTGLTGNSDTLNITNSSFGKIKFTAPGRFFSVNGAQPTVGDSGELSYLTCTNITVTVGGGNDIINLNAGAGPVSYPNLTINGGSGNDTVNLSGTFSLVQDDSLVINLQASPTPGVGAVNVAANSQVFATGIGAITVQCSENVEMASGSGFHVQDGDITVDANQQATPTSGNFIGVNLDGATLKSTGAGYIFVNGTGGDDSGGFQLGVQVINGAKITGGNPGFVIINGNGGNSTNFVNRGVTVYGTGSAITSSGGPIYVTGNAGTNGSFFGIGVSVLFGGQIVAGGTGLVQITATGAGHAGSGANQGLELSEANSLISSGGGSITINGIAGPGGSSGILMANSSAIITPAAGGNILLYSDSDSLDSTISINTTNPASSVTFGVQTFGTLVDLGGANVAGNPATLGLTDAELDRVNTANLFLGFNSGGVTISAPITHPYATNLTILPGLFGALHATNSGTDISLAGNGMVSVHFGAIAFPITGPAPDSGYPQLKVTGRVEINTASLTLSNSTYAGNVGDTFTLINNDGNDPVIGTFNGLPEGAYVSLAGKPAQIHYAGGDGNDVVLVRANPQIFSTRALTNGTWNFNGIGIQSNRYVVQATTNFITWTNIGFATGNVSGTFSFADTNASRFQYRFYRTTN